MVRGFGVVLYYTCDLAFGDRNRERAYTNLLIPTMEADKIGFGVLAGDGRLGMPDLAMVAEDGSSDGIDATMTTLDIPHAVQRQIRRQWKDKDLQNSLHELICLACPFLSRPESAASIVCFGRYRESRLHCSGERVELRSDDTCGKKLTGLSQRINLRILL